MIPTVLGRPFGWQTRLGAPPSSETLLVPEQQRSDFWHALRSKVAAEFPAREPVLD
jgi:hypothetical protein